jgi:hypothetical protein
MSKARKTKRPAAEWFPHALWVKVKRPKRQQMSRLMAWEHFLRGLHSRIPICCVTFYMKTFLPRKVSGDRGNVADRHWARAYSRRCRALKRFRPQYCPCLDCLRDRTFSKLHECTRRCRKQPGSIFFGWSDRSIQRFYQE